MRYSELVQAIRNNTLENLIIILRDKSLCKLEGSSRDAYMFETHVVKVNSWTSDVNAREYTSYCNFRSGISNVPVVFTRKYVTTDNQTVLIQERLLRVIQLVGYSELQAHMYDSVANDGSRETLRNLRMDLISAGIPVEAFWDGMQCGYNRFNRVCFYDYPDG